MLYIDPFGPKLDTKAVDDKIEVKIINTKECCGLNFIRFLSFVIYYKNKTYFPYSQLHIMQQ